MRHSTETRQRALSKLANQTINEVSHDTGIATQTLYNWIRKYGIDYNIGDGKRTPALCIDALKSLIREKPNLTEAEIADALNVDRGAVTRGIAALKAFKVWCVPHTNIQKRIINSATSEKKKQQTQKLYRVVKIGGYPDIAGIASDMQMGTDRVYQLCREAEIKKRWCFKKKSNPAAILKSIQDNPDWTLQMHADLFGVTRQYVQQVKAKAAQG